MSALDPSALASTGSDTRFQAGAVIDGKYELLRELASGGMGAVWVAHNRLLDIDVALKLIRNDLATEEFAERFLREARIAARLEHPGIVRVVDVGHTEQHEPFIVMELLDGEDLRSLVEREGRMNPVDAVATMLPVAEALVVAHEHGVVHRDLKPENIFLARASAHLQPTIIDFGVALSPASSLGRRMTMEGVAVGSPDYMSPEQTRGAAHVDARADVWAFSAVLYELVTGTAPFGDYSEDCLMDAINTAPVLPLEMSGVDAPELWAILARGLEKDPERRWASMNAVGTALARWLRQYGVDQDVCGRSLGLVWLGETRGSLAPAAVTSVARPAASRRQGLAALGVALAIAAVGWVGSRPLPVQSASAAGGTAKPTAGALVADTLPRLERPAAARAEPPAATAAEPVRAPDARSAAATAAPSAALLPRRAAPGKRAAPRRATPPQPRYSNFDVELGL